MLCQQNTLAMQADVDRLALAAAAAAAILQETK
jgi:hypothetical protein